MKFMNVLHRSVIALVILGLALAPAAQSDVNKVQSIKMEKSPEGSKYIIEQSGSADYQDFLLNNPRRLVVDLVGARHGLEQYNHTSDGQLVKAVRSSQFSNDPDEVTRIVFDLSDSARYKVSRHGTSVEVSFYSADAGEKDVPATMEASFGSAWNAPTKALDEPEAGAVEPLKAQPQTAQPKPVQPVTTQPQTAQPKPVQSQATQPQTVQPKPVQPVTTQPQTVQPKPVQPQATQSQMAQPQAQNGASGWTSPTTEDLRTTMESQPKDYLQMARANSGNTPAGGHASTIKARAYPSELKAYQGGGDELPNKSMTIDAQGADIKTVLRSISEFSGANIIAGPTVEGPVTVHLTDVPWRECLDIILKANGYGLREDFGIYRVQVLDELHDEEVDKAIVAQKKEDLEPLVSTVVELNFTTAKDMQMAMNKVTTKRGSISVEKGTNAVIINDIPRVVERIAAMVVSLDRKVAQIEIVAKMVDVDVEASQEIGVDWSLQNIQNSDIDLIGHAYTHGTPVDPFGGVQVGTIKSWGQIVGAIEALAKENKADIISNPRITTSDNIEATILVGKEIPLIVSDEAGNPITELKKTGIVLRVTPHVNSDLSVTLDLNPEISDLASQATVQGGIIITVAEAHTKVIVGDGETAVIGGLITEVESTNEQGIPVIKDVPFIGNLFKFNSKTKKKRELIIFVTPRIVDMGDELSSN